MRHSARKWGGQAANSAVPSTTLRSFFRKTVLPAVAQDVVSSIHNPHHPSFDRYSRLVCGRRSSRWLVIEMMLIWRPSERDHHHRLTLPCSKGALASRGDPYNHIFHYLVRVDGTQNPIDRTLFFFLCETHRIQKNWNQARVHTHTHTHNRIFTSFSPHFQAYFPMPSAVFKYSRKVLECSRLSKSTVYWIFIQLPRATSVVLGIRGETLEKGNKRTQSTEKKIRQGKGNGKNGKKLERTQKRRGS